MKNKIGSVQKIGIAVAAAFAVGTLTAAAADAAPEKKGWESTAALALTLTRGNSDTLLGTASVDTKRKWEKDEAFFGLAAGYGETKDKANADVKKTSEFINGFGQYNRLFNERLYSGLRLDGNYDNIARLDYRLRLAPLLGYYLIKEKNTTLALEAGPSYVLEQYREIIPGSTNSTLRTVKNDYAGLRLGERLDHKLSETTKVWQSLEYVPSLSHFDSQYVATFEAGIDSSITKQWSLRLVFQDIYNSHPGNKNKKNDMRLLAGTAYKF